MSRPLYPNAGPKATYRNANESFPGKWFPNHGSALYELEEEPEVEELEPEE